MLDQGSIDEPRTLTPATVLVGLALVVLTNVASCYSHYICRSSYIAEDYFPLCVSFPFFILLGIGNLAVHYLGRALGRPAWGFSGAQILVIVVMMLVASTIPTYGLIGELLPAITGIPWYSSAEYPWMKTLFPHLNKALMPTDMEAVRLFYYGTTGPIPWGAWAVPMLAWGGLIFAFYIFCLTVVSVFTRQWMDEERIRFPIAQAALEMVKGVTKRSVIPDIFRSKLFWLGALVPAICLSTRIINFFFPGFRPIVVEYHYAGPFNFGIIFVIVGFTFLASREIQFSVWFFHVIMVIQMAIMAKFGISERRIGFHSLNPIAGWESFGAFMVYVLVSLFLARRLLWRVVKKAFGRDDSLDDSDQFLSSRVAVFGFIFSFVYIAAWLRWAGMSWKVELVFMPLMLLIFIGITRAVLETGLVWLRGPSIAQIATAHLMGAKGLTVGSLGAMAYAYSIHSDIKAFFMPAAAHGAYIGREKRIPMRPLTVVIMISLIVAIVTSMGYTLYLGYRYGMGNSSTWLFGGSGRQPWLFMQRWMDIKPGAPGYEPSASAWTYTLIGAGVAAALYVMRFRFSWWPLHPIGLAFALILPIRITACSVFVAWLAKTIILKLGGVKLYDVAKNFFLGLIFGYVMFAGIALLVDFAFFRPGHFIYGW